MKHLFYIPIALLYLAGCSSQEGSDSGTETTASTTENPLLGSWELVSYIAEGDTTGQWSSYGDEILYQKHITPTHFTWFRYNTTEDQLEGIGGGTYSYQDGIYTENIEFFLPPGSNELGQAIPFTVQFDGDTWLHKGYAKEMMIDEETGNMEVQDSSKIEEKWQRVTAQPNSNDLNVIGSWELQSYRESDSEARMEYPGFIQYIKHITPTHFIWIKYDTEGDQVFESGAGTYTVDNDKYIESIKMMYPSGSGTVGTDIEFTYEMEDSLWYHMGYVNRININEEGSPREDLLIDEAWKRIEK